MDNLKEKEQKLLGVFGQIRHHYRLSCWIKEKDC